MKNVKKFIAVALSIFFLGISGCAPAKRVAVPPFGDELQKQSTPEVVEEDLSGPPPPDSKAITKEKEEAYSVQGELDREEMPIQEKDSLGGEGPISLPDAEFLESRLGKYEGVLAKWNNMAGRMLSADAVGGEWPPDWHECVQNLEYMVAGYNRLLNIARFGNLKTDSFGRFDPWAIVIRDVNYPESNCEDVFSASFARLDELAADFVSQNKEQMAQLIKSYMDQGDYKAAISAYENLASVEQSDKIDGSIKQLYVKALAKDNQLQKSLDFLDKSLLKEGGPQPAPLERSSFSWQSSLEYADQLLASGQDEEARKIYFHLDDLFVAMEKDSNWVAGQLHFLADYEKNSKEYGAYLRLLDEYVKSKGSGVSEGMKKIYSAISREYQGTEFMSSARFVLRRAQERTEIGRVQQEDQYDAFFERSEFGGNLEGSGSFANGMDGGGEGETGLSVAEIEGGEIIAGQQLSESEKNEVIWREAENAYGQRNYEKAIGLFQRLLATDYKEAAEKKIALAIDDLVVSLRKQAANLFVQAQRVDDPYEKGRLLKRSRFILIRILQDYPNIEATENIERNLLDLEEQMRNFNPGLIDNHS